MPDRIIRDELLTSERYWTVCDEAKLLYIHILLCADDTARYTARNFSLRQKCFAGRSMEPERMERLLNELADHDMIRLYEVDGERYLFVPRFRQRLRFHNSKFHAPPKEINDLPEQKTDLSKTQDSLKSAEVKRSEVKRSEEKIGVSAKADPSSTKNLGSRLPDDWVLPSEWALWAMNERPDLNPADIADKFRDYWHGVAGAKGRKANWQATWRNFVRAEFSPRATLAKPTNSRSGGYAEVL